DLFTAWERLGPGALDPGGARFAWIGDGNNMAHSWIEAAAILGLDLSLACPEGYDPDAEVIGRARRDGDWRAHIDVVRHPTEAARGSTVLSNDVWASMGEEGEASARQKALAGFNVDDALLKLPGPYVIVLHCLPAHRGEEITDAVLEGPHSAVFQQAENRLHVQKAILERLLSPR
ncbi:MAG: ornithine carbamoyltransferase, partial [Polyangia bacterium]